MVSEGATTLVKSSVQMNTLQSLQKLFYLHLMVVFIHGIMESVYQSLITILNLGMQLGK
jgi:multimeric flavodoxin WrbA